MNGKMRIVLLLLASFTLYSPLVAIADKYDPDTRLSEDNVKDTKGETPERVAAGNFVKKLQTLTAEGKRQELAKLVNYPLTVDGKERIKNANAFVKSYDAIFTKIVQTCLREHNRNEEIFSRNGQYMVGWGCIWFSLDEKGGMTIDAISTKAP